MPTVRLRDASEHPEPADTLQLESDMGHIPPVDPTPAPGGPVAPPRAPRAASGLQRRRQS